ncbi:hypothetical protein BOX15_Mlig033924g1, partial [Macrostomum lignano]
VQRVSRAAVVVDGATVGEIGRGICVLLGICQSDTAQDADWMSKKLLNLRLFDENDEQGGKRWMKSVRDLGLEVLVVSQFTLHATLKGNKPDFRRAMATDQAEKMYADILESMRRDYQEDKIKAGVFGAMMEVSSTNCGPVTISLDTREPKTAQQTDEAAT